MKPRKTRIRVETLSNGRKKYIPEHKRWLFWYDFSDYEGYSVIEHTNPYTHRKDGTTLEIAQKQIDQYLNYFAKEENIRNTKVVKTEYVKYP